MTIDEKRRGGQVQTQAQPAHKSEGDDDQRQARMLLTHVVEPGTAALTVLVQQQGATQVVSWLEQAQRPGAKSACAKLTSTGLSRASLEVLLQRANGVSHRMQATHKQHQRLGVRFVMPGDTQWPTQLDDLGASAPLGLWVRGKSNLRLWALQSVGIVGARASTEYGRSTTTALAADLAQQGWCVVSGAAYGIDAAAHHGALMRVGRTVAVLACGVDVVYPPSNVGLLRDIAHQGLIISEFPSGSRVYRSRFLQRNRLIAALTRGVVVVEAAMRSGALNTANHALGINRQVMAVPGAVHSAMSAGCHELIRSGAACLVTDARDVLGLLGPLNPSSTNVSPSREASYADQESPQAQGGQDEDPAQSQSSLSQGALRLPFEQFSPNQAQVYAALGVTAARGFDDLMVRTGLTLPVITSALGVLEAAAVVASQGSGWVRLQP